MVNLHSEHNTLFFSNGIIYEIYLGNVIHKEGRISECVKDRTQVGSRAYAANHHMLKSKIIKRCAEMKKYIKR